MMRYVRSLSPCTYHYAQQGSCLGHCYPIITTFHFIGGVMFRHEKSPASDIQGRSTIEDNGGYIASPVSVKRSTLETCGSAETKITSSTSISILISQSWLSAPSTRLQDPQPNLDMLIIPWRREA